jgi:hypothetical protein
LFVEHLKGQLVPGGKTDLFGNASLLTALAVPGPVFRQVEAVIDQGVAKVADVAEVDTDLAVLNFAKATTPLTLDANGLFALLDEGGRIEDEDTIGLAQTLCYLVDQFADERFVIPGNLTDELLETLTFAVVKVGDTLSILALQVGEQTADVMMGVGALLRAAQGSDEGFQESFQTGQKAAQQGRADLSIVEQFIQAGLIAAFHDSSPLGRPSPPESLYANVLRSGRSTIQ